MKSRVSFMIGLLTAFVSYFAILILSYAQTDVPELVNAQELIKKAFPNSKITWTKEMEGEMVNFRATSTALAIRIGNGYKGKIRFINFKDTTEWEIECDYNSCRDYDDYELFGGDNTKLSIKRVTWNIGTRVIGDKGEEIFNLALKSWLYPSPSGRFYYTQDNPDSYNLLKVYDEKGQFLWDRKPPGLRPWLSHALSDSELIYKDYKGCILLNALTGQEIWSNTSEDFASILFPAGALKIYSAFTGNCFIVVDEQGLVSVTNQGEILWTNRTSRVILAAAISEGGRFVAIYTQELKAKNQKRLELLDNFNYGKLIWDSVIETPIKEIPSEVHGLRIRGDVVSLTPGIVPYYINKSMTSGMQTFYFEIDPESGELLNKYIIDGVCETIETDGKKIHYLLTDIRGRKQIFRIEQAVAKKL